MQDGSHYMIYTPSDPLLFVATKVNNLLNYAYLLKNINKSAAIANKLQSLLLLLIPLCMVFLQPFQTTHLLHLFQLKSHFQMLRNKSPLEHLSTICYYVPNLPSKLTSTCTYGVFYTSKMSLNLEIQFQGPWDIPQWDSKLHTLV